MHRGSALDIVCKPDRSLPLAPRPLNASGGGVAPHLQPGIGVDDTAFDSCRRSHATDAFRHALHVMSRSTVSRRDFLFRAGASLALLAETPAALSAVSIRPTNRVPHGSIAARLAEELPPFDGVFVADDATCEAMATDWGHYLHRVPLGVLFPKSARDFSRVVTYAAERGIRVAVRGTGGASYGQALADGGIVVCTASFAAASWAGADHIDAQPGAMWSDVVDLALTRGFAPLVYPDTLFITVGGTLSVGGIGETSFRRGGMVDHVEEMDVVTGTGALVTCSSQRNAALFHAMLGGMGQCGTIVRARLRVWRAPARVGTRRRVHADAESFLRASATHAADDTVLALAGLVTRRPDSTGWDYALEVTTEVRDDSPRPEGTTDAAVRTRTYAEYLHRNTRTYHEGVARGARQQPHAYLAGFLPATGIAPFLAFVTGLSADALGTARMAVFPARPAAFRQPLFQMPQGEVAWHVRVYRIADVARSPGHEQILRLNRDTLLPKLFALGGHAYMPFAPPLTGAQREAQFGPAAWSAFQDARRTHDPRGLLGPGVGLFA